MVDAVVFAGVAVRGSRRFWGLTVWLVVVGRVGLAC